MARAYSQDLRDRVIDAALGGMPARRVAAQFEIGVATAIVWVRRGKPEKAIRMIRLTTLGRSNLGCTGSNLLSKHSHVSLSRSGKKTMKRVLVQDSWRRVQPWTSREPGVSDKVITGNGVAPASRPLYPR